MPNTLLDSRVEKVIVTFLIGSLLATCFIFSARPNASIQNIDVDMSRTVTPATPTPAITYVYHSQMRRGYHDGAGDSSPDSRTYTLHVKRNPDTSGITALYVALGLRRNSTTDDQFANATYVALLSGGDATATMIWWEDGTSQIMQGNITGIRYNVYGVAQILAPTNALDNVPANNIQAAGTLLAVSCKEDLTGDGFVDIFESLRMGTNFGRTGSPGWIPEDLMSDGVIDYFDVFMVNRRMNWNSAHPTGQAYAETWPLSVHHGQTDYAVPVYSDYVVYSKSYGFDLASRQFSFNVTSDVGGFCDVTIPAALMSGDFTVYLDGIPTPCEVTTDGTHYFIHFTSTGLNHRVIIESTIAGGHDVAITNVASFRTAVGQGFGESINATVSNQGDFTETFNVTAFANATVVGSDNVTLLAGESTTVMFNWNTSGFAYGNYTINATAEPVLGEINTGDNSFTGSKVLVTIPGDINLDGLVDIFDAIRLAIAFGSKPPNPNFNPNADINGDLTVDLFDAILLAGHYAQHIP